MSMTPVEFAKNSELAIERKSFRSFVTGYEDLEMQMNCEIIGEIP